MTALTTHDTKRSEDVRARIALLSEIPDEWAAVVHDWHERTRLQRQGSPLDDNIVYLFWQTLVGAWPLTRERLGGYLEKATREAKQNTSWIDPDPDYDQAVQDFVAGVFANHDLLADVEAFVERLAPAWHTSAVAQKLIQLTMPGVPDLYQGSELWTLTLVDPDNRGPVDYALRTGLLHELAALEPEAIWARAAEGLPKLAVSRAALALRAERPAAFGADGSYEPLRATGGRADHLVGFVRGAEAITLAPRLVLGLGGDWADTEVALPPGRWRDVLTGDLHEGGPRPVGELLRRLPVGLLSRVGA